MSLARDATTWTGGQYSLFRAALGTYLLVHFALLIPYGTEVFSSAGALPDATTSPLIHAFPNLLALVDSPGAVATLLSLGVVAAFALILGWRDRIAAVILWYLLACLFGRNPLIANPSLPFIGWLLLAHAVLSTPPFGSLTARGRTDPGGGWAMPASIWTAAWVVMSLGYSYSGYTKLVSPSWLDGTAMAHLLENPLARDTPLRLWVGGLPSELLQLLTWGGLAAELAFAPLALFRRTRVWAWLMMVLMHLGLLCLIDFADLTMGMLVLHLFTFNPAWVAGRHNTAPRTVFYDGTCGLCHRAIRWLLAEDPSGSRFSFAPLHGETFTTLITEDMRAQLPDTFIVVDPDAQMHIRGDAVAVLLRDLGGLWRALGWLLVPVPHAVRDTLYDQVAAHRFRLFSRPTEACPLIPPALRPRFLP